MWTWCNRMWKRLSLLASSTRFLPGISQLELETNRAACLLLKLNVGWIWGAFIPTKPEIGNLYQTTHIYSVPGRHARQDISAFRDPLILPDLVNEWAILKQHDMTRWGRAGMKWRCPENRGWTSRRYEGSTPGKGQRTWCQNQQLGLFLGTCNPHQMGPALFLTKFLPLVWFPLQEFLIVYKGHWWQFHKIHCPEYFCSSLCPTWYIF